MNNVIFTKATIFRNIKDYKFVPKLEEEKKGEIVDKLTTALKGKMSLLNLPSIDDKVKRHLFNMQLINSNYPSLFVSEKDNISLSLFGDEHIKITATSYGFDKKVFKRACDLANALSNKINMSYNDQYGYLMSDIKNIGSGVRLECTILLPAINRIGKIDQVKQNVKKLGYNLSSTNKSEKYILSTVCNLGFTESEIVNEFSKMVQKLQDLEVESAKVYDVEHHDEILDRVYRSQAILNSAYILQYDELLSHIKSLIMGLDLGLIDLPQDCILDLIKLEEVKLDEFISKGELIDLASKVKDIMKGNKI